jgi:hypothetical protein
MRRDQILIRFQLLGVAKNTSRTLTGIGDTPGRNLNMRLRQDDFKKRYLPHFEIEQRLAVSEVLEWYQHWYLAQKGYEYDEPDDVEEDSGKISETIALVWQSES